MYSELSMMSCDSVTAVMEKDLGNERYVIKCMNSFK